MSNKSVRTKIYRDKFVDQFGITSLRVLSALCKQDAGRDVDIPVSKTSATTYKANLSRGVYRPYVGPNFKQDRLNLINCNR